jgi:hypothetical protein
MRTQTASPTPGEPVPAGTMRIWWVAGALWLLCGFCALTGTFYHGSGMFSARKLPLIRGLDDTYYFLWLPKLVVDHNLDFGSALAGCPSITESDYLLEIATPRTATGRQDNKFPIGWALANLPFYLAARGLALVFQLGDRGWEPIYQVAVWIGQLAYAALAFVGVWRILSRWFPASVAAAAVAVGWLVSPLIYYQSAALSLSHSQVFAFAVLATWISLGILEGSTGPWRFAGLGLVAGLLVVTRLTAAAYLICPALALVEFLRSRDAGRTKLARLALFAAAAAIPLLAQGAAWKVLYGSWLGASYAGESFHWSQPHLIDVLFSPLHGAFYWHPVLLPGLVAGGIWALRRTALTGWIASCVLMWVLNSAWHSWWFGVSFGNRAFEGTVFLAMAGIAVLLARANRSRLLGWLVPTLLGAAVVWNLLLFALFLTKRIPGEAPVTWGDALHAGLQWIGP